MASHAGANCLNDPRLDRMHIAIVSGKDGIRVEGCVHFLDGRMEAISFPWPKKEGIDFAVASILFQKLKRIMADG